MYSALNFAVGNRYMIIFGVHEAFGEVFEAGMEIPDLMHNYALKEFYRSQPMLVHR